MKYLDKSGKPHSSMLKAIGANIKITAGRLPAREMMCSPDEDKFFDEAGDLKYHPTPQATNPAATNITDLYKAIDQSSVAASIHQTAINEYNCEYIVIDYEAGDIIAYGKDSKIISRSKIDERLLYGLAKDALESTLGEIGSSESKIIDISSIAVKNNMTSINSAATAAAGKNFIVSPQVTDELIDSCAAVVADVMNTSPTALRSTGKNGVKTIMEMTINRINQILDPTEGSDSPSN